MIARAAQQAREDVSHARVAVRFIGVTPGSADGRALLDSLCHQVSTLYGADASSLPADYQGLAQELPKRLALATADQPLVVFLDALDQFTEFDPARFLNWLPVALPAHVRLVVSLPPGDRQVLLERRLPAGNLVALEPMASDEGEALLDLWLRDAGRTLQSPQRDEVLAKFGGNGLPLYLRFAFEEARRWPSYADPRRTGLSNDIVGIVRGNLFARLADEANHGAMLVARSLGYLAAAKNGLAEDELLDVLSRDAEVLADFHRRSPRSPMVDHLPVVVWSRLSFDLEPYLSERAADGVTLLTFYHRQLREAATADYLAGTARTERHRALAAYFHDQDLEFRRDGETIANLRKLVELPYQQTLAKQWDGLEATLITFDFIAAKSRADMVHDLLGDYTRALASWPGSDRGGRERQNAADLSTYRDHLLRFARGEDRTFTPLPSKWPRATDTMAAAPHADRVEVDPQLRIAAYRQFVAAHAHLLAKWRGLRPILLQFAFNSARDSPVALAAAQILASTKGPQLLEPGHLRRVWNPLPALTRTIEAHSTSVNALDFSADGQQLLSLGGGQLTLWEVESHDILNARELPRARNSKDVYEARLSADGSRIVTLEWFTEGSDPARRSRLSVWTQDGVGDQRITADGASSGLALTSDASWAATFRARRLEEWDLREGARRLWSMETPSLDIGAVAMSSNGHRIVTAHHDLVIRLHDLAGEASPTTAPLVADEILAMRFTPDARLLVAYEKDEEQFLAVLGPSRAWELSLTLGDANVKPIAWTSNASTTFVAQNNGTIRAFDLSTGAVVRTFHTAFGSIEFIALHARDSQLVAFSYDWPQHRRATDTWTLGNGHHTRRIAPLGEKSWTPRALLSDGNMLVTSPLSTEDGIDVLELRTLHTGQLVRALGPWDGGTCSVVAPRDGRRVFTGSHRSGILEWNLDATIPAQSIGHAGCTIRELDADALGSVGVSSEQDEPIRVWDLRTRVRLQEIAALSDWGAKVCISPDGRLAASGECQFVLRVWDGRPGETRAETRRLTGHRSTIASLSLTPDGHKLMSGSTDTTARVWDLVSGEVLVLRGHEDRVKAVSLTADGKLGVSWAADMTLRVWDLAAAQELKMLEHSSERVDSLSLTASGSAVVTGDEHGRIKFWDVENGHLGQRERRHRWFVNTVCLLPRSKNLVSGSGDATIGIWDLGNRDRDLVLSASDRSDLEADRTLVVPFANGFASAGEDGAIRIWDVTLRQCLTVLRDGDRSTEAHLAATADGLRLVAASDNDKDIRVWDVARSTCIRSIRTTGYKVRAFDLSPDGRTAVSVADAQKGYMMQLWDLHDGRCLRAIPLSHAVYASRFTPRGDRVLLNFERDVELWDLTLGDRIWRTSGKLAATNPTGDDAVVASEDALCRVDLSTGASILEFRGHKGRLSDLQVMAHGRWLVSAGFDERTVRVWNIDSGGCVAIEALESRPWTLSRMSAQGLFGCGTEAGEVLIRQVSGIEIGPLLVTPVRLWIADANPHWDGNLVVRCPECGRLTPARDGTAPALPVILCPGCGTQLRLSPFAIDNRGRF